MKKFFNEFKEFAIKGNMIDLAVGVIIGGAFNAIVSSLVADIFTPALGLIFGSDTGLDNLNGLAGSINLGNFLSAIINFILTAFCLFLFVKAVNKAREAGKKEEEAPAEPEEPKLSDEAQLLTEIKELLQNR